MKRFRRRQNVKNNTPAAWPVRGTALAILAASLALGYLWIHTQCERTARQIKRHEQKFNDLTLRVQREEYEWTNLRSLSGVRKQLTEFGLVMSWPDSRRIVYLRVPRTMAPGGPDRSLPARVAFHPASAPPSL
ncbi:MAG: hypothetical protein KBA51_03060 [Kiritimatiellae bacterium]|nr:hypothetical protein [Kiritimatiellia bacterium]